jgi:hypothetical protein
LVPLWLRAMLTYSTTALFLLSFFGSHPQYLRYPQLPSVLIVLFASNCIYVLIGHIIYLLAKKSFLQGQALARAAAELAVESQKSERLLLNVLPAAIAARLKEEQKPIADGFASVTVLFADIVGFTQLAASLPPHELVKLLNGVFSEFDEVAERGPITPSWLPTWRWPCARSSAAMPARVALRCACGSASTAVRWWLA